MFTSHKQFLLSACSWCQGDLSMFTRQTIGCLGLHFVQGTVSLQAFDVLSLVSYT